MVTVRDLLEMLAGDVLAGVRPAHPEAVQRADGSWLVDGMLSTEELRALVGRDGTDERGEHGYRTLAGLVLERLDHLPAVGDALEWDGLRIEVVDLDGRRIDKLLVRPTAARE